MNIRGVLSFSTDDNIFYRFPENKMIIVSDNAEQYVNKFPNNSLVGSVLLPPYEAMMEYANGDTNNFNNIYYSYLCSSSAKSFMNVVIRALFDGANITLFIPNNEMEIGFDKCLLSFVQSVYGIIPATETNHMFYDNIYDVQLLSILFVDGLLDLDVFILAYPKNVSLLPEVIPMLMTIMPTPFRSGDVNDYVIWYNGYKDRSQNVGEILTIPVTKG